MKIPVEEQYKYVKLTLPDGSKAEGQAVLLHACYAPCSSAIVECMLRNGMKPTVYFSNSNIYPLHRVHSGLPEIVSVHVYAHHTPAEDRYYCY